MLAGAWEPSGVVAAEPFLPACPAPPCPACSAHSCLLHEQQLGGSVCTPQGNVDTLPLQVNLQRTSLEGCSLRPAPLPPGSASWSRELTACKSKSLSWIPKRRKVKEWATGPAVHAWCSFSVESAWLVPGPQVLEPLVLGQEGPFLPLRAARVGSLASPRIETPFAAVGSQGFRSTSAALRRAMSAAVDLGTAPSKLCWAPQESCGKGTLASSRAEHAKNSNCSQMFAA